MSENIMKTNMISKSTFHYTPKLSNGIWSVWVHHAIGFHPSIGWQQVNNGKWKYKSSVGSMGHQQLWETDDQSAIDDWNMAHAMEKYQEMPSI